MPTQNQLSTKSRRLILVLAALGVLFSGSAVAGTAHTVWGVENVPLMDGMREEYAIAAPRKIPGERSAQAILTGNMAVTDAMAFYAEELPAEGWRRIQLSRGAEREPTLPMLIMPNGAHIQMFQTDEEILTLTASLQRGKTVLSVEIWVKEEVETDTAAAASAALSN